MPQRAILTEQFLRDAGPQHHHPGGVFLFIGGEETPLTHRGFAHTAESAGGAQNGDIRQRGAVALDILRGGIFHRYPHHPVDLIHNGLRVVHGQTETLRKAPSPSDRDGRKIIGDEQQVGAQTVYLLGDLGFSASRHRHHHNHGRHADDHSQHGQRRTQFIAEDALQRHTDYLTQVHNAASILDTG